MSERPLPPISKEELDLHRVPANMRDYCVHLLVPLNACRRENYYMPFKCGDERHAYEKCEYDEFLRRMEIRKKELAEKNKQ